MQSKQLNTLQAGRALAALAVVLHHTYYVLSAPRYFGASLAAAWLIPAKSGVQFFFVLSGFVIYLAHRNDIAQPTVIGSFLWKRFRRIYPPLWMALALVTAAFFLIPGFGQPIDRSPATILAAFTAAPCASEHLLLVEWTLRHEVLFYLLFSLLLLHRRLGCVVLGVWFGLSATVPWLHPNSALDFLFSANHVLFGLGILVCMVFQSTVFSSFLAWTSLLSGIVLFTLAWWQQGHLANPYLNPPVQILLFGLGAALIILGLICLERSGRISTARSLIFLGEASYAIYLVHHPVMVLAAKLLIATPLRAHPVAGLLLLALAGILGGIVFHLALERPVTRLLSQKRASPAAATV